MLTKHLSYHQESQIQWGDLWQKVAQEEIEFLDLSKGNFNRIEFPSFPLPSLKVLELSYQEQGINTLEIPAHVFPNLEYLFAYKSKLKAFSIKGTLGNLKELNLQKNELKKIPKNILNLCPALEYLDLSRGNFNRIEFPDFPLPSLKVLELSYQEQGIDTLEIPAHVFPNLEYLFAYGSKLKAFSIKGTLENLKELNLEQNQINNLELSNIVRFPALESLFLSGNPLQNIPKEIFEKKRENVLQAVRDYAKYTPEETLYLREGKMILIGNGKVGKTSIRLKLLDREATLPKDEERTPGIEVAQEKYKVEDIEVDTYEVQGWDFFLHIWDFGGQGKYREVQQLFCSRKSLYLFVTSVNDDTKNEEYVGFEYWLSMANAFNYDQNSNTHSPIIYVLNKIDKGTGLIEEKTIKNTFPNVETFLKISCQKLQNFDKLEQAIKETLPKVSEDIFTTPFPKTWLAIKKALEKEEAKGKTHIFYKEYLSICEQHNIGSQEAHTLLETLDLMGYLIYYGENEKLKDWIILNPRWVKDAIYKVLDNDKVMQYYGEFRPVDFPIIWQEYETPKPLLQRVKEWLKPSAKKYTNPEREKLLNLMLAYEFCYEHKDRRGNPYYLIPALFGEKMPMPEELPKLDKKIRVIYTPFIPAGTVNKLIVRLHRKIYENEFRWKNGVLLEENQAFAEINEDWRNKTVEISMGGKNLATLYQSIIQTLADLNKDLKRTKFLEQLGFQIKVWYDNNWIDAKLLKHIPHSGFEFINSENKFTDKVEDNSETLISAKDKRKALFFISEGEYPEAIALLDKCGIKGHIYAKLKQEYMYGQVDVGYNGRFKVFVSDLEERLEVS